MNGKIHLELMVISAVIDAQTYTFSFYRKCDSVCLPFSVGIKIGTLVMLSDSICWSLVADETSEQHRSFRRRYSMSDATPCLK